ncbi:MAG: hypothetical protein H0V26_09990 [Solirubrobacterales bacterium]|nr:hypothetical protein [Solirubrobacterales bacterium]
MAVRTPSQLAKRRRVEHLIRVAAPALDVLLFVGHHVSRVTGRNESDPEPPRRSTAPGAIRASLDAGSGRPDA